MVYIQFTILFFLSLPAVFYAQQIALSYCETISVDTLKKHILVLASDSMQGRETGKPGQKKSATYLENEYKRFGLLPFSETILARNNPGKANVGTGMTQNHPISIRLNKNRNLSFNYNNFLYGKDFFYYSGGKDSIYFFNKLGFLSPGRNQQLGKILKGLNPDETVPLIYFDNNQYRTDSLLWYLKKENSGRIKDNQLIFLIENEETIQERFINQSNQIPENDANIIYLSYGSVNSFLSQGRNRKLLIKAGKKKRVISKHLSCEGSVAKISNTSELSGQNVVAFIPGSDLIHETIVISSHYDHLGKRDTSIYFGADDNASGTSAVLEIARAFSRAKNEGHGPRRNILILNVSGEEKGLLGSSWFVEHCPVSLTNIVANLNIDMVGRTDPKHDSTGTKDYTYIIGSGRLSSELDTINKIQNKLGPNLELDFTYDNSDDPNRFYSRSDHYNFAKNKIPVIFYFNGIHTDYHQPTDTPEKIDFDLLRKRTQLVFLTAWDLANRDKRIVVDRMDQQTK